VFQRAAATVHRRQGTHRGRPDERGATLVEFAFVLPVFILFLFAIIDFGWLFTQFLDVKQGAREGARLAIVNDCAGFAGKTCSDELVKKICARTSDLDDKDTTVRLEIPTDEDFTAQVEVEYPARSLTGMMAVFIDNKTLTATVRMRREKPIVWQPGTYSCPLP
jgi:Flp pilus assembly protein TadG